MIKDYKILKSTSYVNLEKNVLSHIRDGWEPIGGIAISENEECYQAMIKRD